MTNKFLTILLIVTLAGFITLGFFYWQMRVEIVSQTGVVESLLKQIDTLGKQIKDLKTKEEISTDETADWKTYRNEEYGFEVKYPPEGIKTEKIDDKILLKFASFDYDTPYLYITVDINLLSLKDWYNMRHKTGIGITYEGAIKREGLTVNENQGVRLIRDAEGCYTEDILISKKERCTIAYLSIDCAASWIDYLDSWTGFPDEVDLGPVISQIRGLKNYKIITKIVNTLKFIEPDTPTWKAYRNEEYGFEVKHPEDWRIKVDHCISFMSDYPQWGGEGSNLDICVEENSSLLSLLDWAIKKYGKGTVVIQECNINEYVKLYRYTPTGEYIEPGPVYFTRFFTSPDQKYIFLFSSGQDPPTDIGFDILSTLKFTE